MSTSSASTRRVLIVEDEPDLRRVLAAYLTRDGYEVTEAATGPDALALARRDDPDVIVLDLGLPTLDGVEVCRRLRTFSDAYVVMLTARDSEQAKVAGLTAGADDYLTKPFSPRELLARIAAMLRRPRSVLAEPASGVERAAFVHGPVSVDPARREVTVHGEPIGLTRTEFDLLVALLEHPGVVRSRRALLDDVWDPGWVGDEHVVDVHLAALRRKLGVPDLVVTVRGVGYRMGTPS